MLKDKTEENKVPEDLFEIHDEPQTSTPPVETETAPQPVQENQPSQQNQPTPQQNQSAQESSPAQNNQINQEEIDRQIKEILKRDLIDKSNLANRIKAERVAASLNKILTFASQKPEFNNLDIRDYLHISQSTATSYLSKLVNSGRLKKSGKSKYTKYSLV